MTRIPFASPRPGPLLLVAACVLLGSSVVALRSSEAKPRKAASAAPEQPDGAAASAGKQDLDAPGPGARFIPAHACSSAACHGRQVAQFDTLRHSHYLSEPKLGERAGCGVCHGPASDHIEDGEHRHIPRLTAGTSDAARRIDQACLSCHTETIRRAHYFVSEHSRAGMSCASCHEVHYDLGTPFLLRLPGLHGPAGQPVAARPARKRKQAPAEEPQRPAAESAPEAPQEAAPDSAPQPASDATSAPPENLPKLETAARTRVPLPGWRSSFTREPSALSREDAVNELCLSCHRRTLSELRQFSHHPVAEGRLSCTDCHDPHHEERGQMLARRTVAETCLQCHQNIRGPFLFEHDPAKAGGIGDECLECHRPHGSPNKKLHVLFSRGLCLNCHTDIQQDRKHKQRFGDCWRNGCHSAIHGSNNSNILLEE